jgi:hypothetical protein
MATSPAKRDDFAPKGNQHLSAYVWDLGLMPFDPCGISPFFGQEIALRGQHVQLIKPL